MQQDTSIFLNEKYWQGYTNNAPFNTDNVNIASIHFIYDGPNVKIGYWVTIEGKEYSITILLISVENVSVSGVWDTNNYGSLRFDIAKEKNHTISFNNGTFSFSINAAFLSFENIYSS